MGMLKQKIVAFGVIITQKPMLERSSILKKSMFDFFSVTKQAIYWKKPFVSTPSRFIYLQRGLKDRAIQLTAAKSGQKLGYSPAYC